jgi:hypothetical protein
MTCIRKISGPSLGRGTDHPNWWFSLQENCEIVWRIGHDHFLPQPLQLIIHLSPYHLMLEMDNNALYASERP